MSACRIARRVAWRVRSLNPRTGAVSTRTLATKVFDCCCHLFLLRCGGRLLAGVLWLAVASLNNGECLSAGVALFSRQGSTRRVGCSVTPVATPFVTNSLVTKGKNGDTE
jgi:hypothetical protein